MALRKNYIVDIWGDSNALGTGSDMDNAVSNPTNDNYISAGGGQQLGVTYAEQSACAANYPTACAIESDWAILRCVGPTTVKTFGYEISLGYELNALMGIGTALDGRLWIIKSATGGTNMLDWAPISYSGGVRHYARALAFRNAMVAKIVANAGTPGPIVNLGLHVELGANDAIASVSSLAYESLMQELITQYLIDIGGAKISMPRLSSQMTTLTYLSNVRTAQDNLAAANAAVTQINMDSYNTNPASEPHYLEDGYFYGGAQGAIILDPN